MLAKKDMLFIILQFSVTPIQVKLFFAFQYKLKPEVGLRWILSA